MHNINFTIRNWKINKKNEISKENGFSFLNSTGGIKYIAH